MPDFLIVLNRLFRLKEKVEEEQLARSASDHIFFNYNNSMLRKEEFRTAIEVFGYREEDLSPLFSNLTVQTIRLALEGRGE